MVIRKKLLIFSETLELYHLLIHHFGAEYEVETYRKNEWDSKKEKLLPTVLNRVTLVIMEIKNCFSESIRIVRQIQLYSFSGYTLFISREENRTRQIEEKIYAIDSGADEYLAYPQTRKVSVDGLEFIFTKTEFAILSYLIFHLNKAVSYEELYEAVWEKEYLHDDMNIMAHIHRIRKKMGDDTKNPLYIQNVYGTRGASPMLIAQQMDAFDDSDWIYELKMDGFRCLSYIDQTMVDFRNKRNMRMLSKFPELKYLGCQIYVFMICV